MLNYNEKIAEIRSYLEKGYSLAEAAESMSVPKNTLYSWIHRARKKYGNNILDNLVIGKRDSLVIDGNSNNVKLVSNQERISTPEQLLKKAGIDLDIWAVERQKINSYEGQAKLDDGTIVVTPMFQIAVWLVKKKPTAIYPVIQPIRLDVEFPTVGKGKLNKDAIFIIPDLHFGYERDISTDKYTAYHDVKMLNGILDIVNTLHPSRIIILGDILDLPEWSSKFVNSSGMKFTTQKAMTALVTWLSELRKVANDARIDVLEGNHDVRMKRAIETHFLSAYDIKPSGNIEVKSVYDLPYLLDFKTLNINYYGNYPDAAVWLGNDTKIIHGAIAKSNPGATSLAILRKHYTNVVFGHIHRIELATINKNTRGDDKLYTGFSPGCACRVDYTVPGHRRGQNWQQGVGIIWHNGKYGGYDIGANICGKIKIDGKTYKL